MRARGPRDLLEFDDLQVGMCVLLIAAGVTASLAASEAIAQSSAVISVTARIVAPCTITGENPESSCSEQTLAQQSDVTNASARISTTEDDTVVTHTGGLPPTIEILGKQISVNF